MSKYSKAGLFSAETTATYAGTVFDAGVYRTDVAQTIRGIVTGPMVMITLTKGHGDITDLLHATCIKIKFGMVLDGVDTAASIYHIDNPDDKDILNINNLSTVPMGGKNRSFKDFHGMYIVEHSVEIGPDACISRLWFSNDLVLEMKGNSISVETHPVSHHFKCKDETTTKTLYTMVEGI